MRPNLNRRQFTSLGAASLAALSIGSAPPKTPGARKPVVIASGNQNTDHFAWHRSNNGRLNVHPGAGASMLPGAWVFHGKLEASAANRQAVPFPTDLEDRAAGDRLSEDEMVVRFTGSDRDASAVAGAIRETVRAVCEVTPRTVYLPPREFAALGEADAYKFRRFRVPSRKPPQRLI